MLGIATPCKHGSWAHFPDAVTCVAVEPTTILDAHTWVRAGTVWRWIGGGIAVHPPPGQSAPATAERISACVRSCAAIIEVLFPRVRLLRRASVAFYVNATPRQN